MGMVRLNITLPENLVAQLDKLVGPRKKSNFIAKSLSKTIKALHEAELHESLAEGYAARKEESLSFAEDFEHVDVEGWDEY